MYNKSVFKHVESLPNYFNVFFISSLLHVMSLWPLKSTVFAFLDIFFATAGD